MSRAPSTGWFQQSSRHAQGPRISQDPGSGHPRPRSFHQARLHCPQHLLPASLPDPRSRPSAGFTVCAQEAGADWSLPPTPGWPPSAVPTPRPGPLKPVELQWPVLPYGSCQLVQFCFPTGLGGGSLGKSPHCLPPSEAPARQPHQPSSVGDPEPLGLGQLSPRTQDSSDFIDFPCLAASHTAPHSASKSILK